MKLTARVPVSAGMMVLLLASTGCNRLRANDQINKGVAEFKNAKYEAATNHFQQAVKIDPDNINPRIYLATSYASQIVPNLDTPENKKLQQNALDNFQQVLRMDPNNVTALKQIASIDLGMGKIAEAKDYQKKVIALDSNDSEAYYTIGVVDWREANENSQKALKAADLTDKGDGNTKLPKPACTALQGQNADLVQQGTQYLKKAVDINTNYEEAYTILSLMSRQQANLECGNADAIKTDLQNADMYAQKSMGARKAIEKQKEDKSHGVAM